MKKEGKCKKKRVRTESSKIRNEKRGTHSWEIKITKRDFTSSGLLPKTPHFPSVPMGVLMGP